MNENDKLKLFENFRKESIDLLEESKIDKDSFLNNNLAYIEKLDLKPFSTINNISQAIYNYQYYNLLAKKANLEAQKINHNPKKKRLYRNYINQRENFYHLKDLATLRLLELIEYKGINSYYIILRSKRLQGEIFEIEVSTIDKVILHSKSKLVLNKLIENDVFSKVPRKSIIDSYVNKSY